MPRPKTILASCAVVTMLVVIIEYLPATAVKALSHRSGLTYQSYAMPGCGVGREDEHLAGGLLSGIGEWNPALLRKLLASPDAEVRASCALVLGEQAERASFEPLLELTTDPDQRVRRCALGALTRFHDPRVTPVLIRALDDPDRLAQLIAMDALRVMENSEAVAAVREWERGMDATYRKRIGGP